MKLNLKLTMYINNKKYKTNKLGIVIYDFEGKNDTKEFMNIFSLLNNNIIYTNFKIQYLSYGRYVNNNRYGIVLIKK